MDPATSQGRPMLPPVPKSERVTSQECVGRNAELATPADMAESERAPLRQINGRAWSPGVYRALRLRGTPLKKAWERACIFSSHF